MLKKIVDCFKEDVLSPYCLDECRQDCCIFGSDQIFAAITVTKPQLDMLTENAEIDPYWNVLDHNNGSYDLYNIKCPRYQKETRLCSAYDNPDRPRACASFPMDTNGEILTLDSECQFIWENWEIVVQELNPWFKNEDIYVKIPTELGFLEIVVESGFEEIQKILSEDYCLLQNRLGTYL